MADVVYVYAILELASSVRWFKVGLIASSIKCREFTSKNKRPETLVSLSAEELSNE